MAGWVRGGGGRSAPAARLRRAFPPAVAILSDVLRRRLSRRRDRRRAGHAAANLEIGRRVEALGACGENLAAGLGAADRMLELRGQRPVAGYPRPAVIQHLTLGPAPLAPSLYVETHARVTHAYRPR